MKEKLRHGFLNLVKPVHMRLRRSKIELFNALVRHNGGGTLLDVGGGLGIGGEFEPLYASFSKVTVVNLDLVPINHLDGVCIRSVRADGCCLPFDSRSFDWVFSNAVIEHVGVQNRQAMFANEIRRVASKGYFVTTPNRRFPIEPHTLFPFYQYLSRRGQRYALKFSLGYLRDFEEIRLLSANELQVLFPEARVRGVGSPFVATSLVAYHYA